MSKLSSIEIRLNYHKLKGCWGFLRKEIQGVIGVLNGMVKMTNKRSLREAGDEKIGDEILEDPTLTQDELTELIRHCYAIRISLQNH